MENKHSENVCHDQEYCKSSEFIANFYSNHSIEASNIAEAADFATQNAKRSLEKEILFDINIHYELCIKTSIELDKLSQNALNKTNKYIELLNEKSQFTVGAANEASLAHKEAHISAENFHTITKILLEKNDHVKKQLTNLVQTASSASIAHKKAAEIFQKTNESLEFSFLSKMALTEDIVEEAVESQSLVAYNPNDIEINLNDKYPSFIDKSVTNDESFQELAEPPLVSETKIEIIDTSESLPLEILNLNTDTQCSSTLISDINNNTIMDITKWGEYLARGVENNIHHDEKILPSEHCGSTLASVVHYDDLKWPPKDLLKRLNKPTTLVENKKTCDEVPSSNDNVIKSDNKPKEETMIHSRSQKKTKKNFFSWFY
jgi:hypothetical protein